MVYLSVFSKNQSEKSYSRKIAIFLFYWKDLWIQIMLRQTPIRLECIWVISPIIDKRLYLTLFDLDSTS